jgi:hypothetical protein
MSITVDDLIAELTKLREKGHSAAQVVIAKPEPGRSRDAFDGQPVLLIQVCGADPSVIVLVGDRTLALEAMLVDQPDVARIA